MGRKDKRLDRFLARPKDYTFEELCTLLNGFGYELDNKGGTSGSRVRFYREKDEATIDLHKPHDPKYLKRYQIDYIIGKLKENGDIE